MNGKHALEKETGTKAMTMEMGDWMDTPVTTKLRQRWRDGNKI